MPRPIDAILRDTQGNVRLGQLDTLLNAVRDASTMKELCATMSGQPGSANDSVGKHLAGIAAVGSHNEVELIGLLREKARDGLAQMLEQGLPLEQSSAVIVHKVALAVTGRSMLHAQGVEKIGTA